ncbi:hypothetical protein KQH54_01950 [bacterium]|nr:hypothetical protein [bacterium]
MAQSEEIKIDPIITEIAQNIFTELANLKPETSLSFTLNEQGSNAISQAIALAEWGIGGNKPKLKEAALENLNAIDEIPPGEPVNVNFTKYEVKAMAEVLSVIEKALETHTDGVLA